jgi:hypothetical protein
LIGDWGLGIGDWGLANPQSPIPNPHTLKVIKIIENNMIPNIKLRNKFIIFKF